MAGLVKKNNYGAINTDDARADGFYIVQFVESPHTLQYDVEVNDEIIKAESLVCAAHYMSPTQEKSRLYLGPEEGDLRTLVKMNNVLVPKLNVSVVTDRSQLTYTITGL